MKAIVIYYSYSGNTKNIALHIAEALNADTAVIDTVKAYEGDYDADFGDDHPGFERSAGQEFGQESAGSSD